jgi:hypothetical protein
MTGLITREQFSHLLGLSCGPFQDASHQNPTFHSYLPQPNYISSLNILYSITRSVEITDFSVCNLFSKNHRVTKPANGTYSVHILIIYFSKNHFNITQPIYCSVSQAAPTLEDFTPLASQHHRSKNCRQKTQWCYKLRTFHHSPVPSDTILRILFSNTNLCSLPRQTEIHQCYNHTKQAKS